MRRPACDHGVLGTKCVAGWGMLVRGDGLRDGGGRCGREKQERGKRGGERKWGRTQEPMPSREGDEYTTTYYVDIVE